MPKYKHEEVYNLSEYSREGRVRALFKIFNSCQSSCLPYLVAMFLVCLPGHLNWGAEEGERKRLLFCILGKEDEDFRSFLL